MLANSVSCFFDSPRPLLRGSLTAVGFAFLPIALTSNGVTALAFAAISGIALGLAAVIHS